ncbi:arginine deiminase family protein, partial [Staphylococcus aureus]|uniref:arginine deiminase family protein n=1 Tax=Staphylococcus aureus TaxID=1280 RepID=UPI0021B28BEA
HLLPHSKKTILPHQQQINPLFPTLSNQQLLHKIISPLPNQQINPKSTHLLHYIHHNYPFYLHPIPNLYFTTHPQPSIPHGITINRIFWRARR